MEIIAVDIPSSLSEQTPQGLGRRGLVLLVVPPSFFSRSHLPNLHGRMFSRRRAASVTVSSISAISRLRLLRLDAPPIADRVTFASSAANTSSDWGYAPHVEPQKPPEPPEGHRQRNPEASVSGGRFQDPAGGREWRQNWNGREVPNGRFYESNSPSRDYPSAAHAGAWADSSAGNGDLRGGGKQAATDNHSSDWNGNVGNWHDGAGANSQGHSQVWRNGTGIGMGYNFRQPQQKFRGQMDQQRMGGMHPENPTAFLDRPGGSFQGSRQPYGGNYVPGTYVHQQTQQGPPSMAGHQHGIVGVNGMPPGNHVGSQDRCGGNLEGFQHGCVDSYVTGTAVPLQTQQVPSSMTGYPQQTQEARSSMTGYQHGVNAGPLYGANGMQQRPEWNSGYVSHSGYPRGDVQQGQPVSNYHYHEIPNHSAPGRPMEYQDVRGVHGSNGNNFGWQNPTPSQSGQFGSYINDFEGNNAESNNQENTRVATVEELDDICKECDVEKAVEVLGLLEKQGILVDLPRYYRLLQLCGDPICAEEARIVHDHLLRTHKNVEVEVYNKILDMYSKCGSMDDAHKLFEMMLNKDTTSWGTMITGLANNGFGEEAIDLFTEFKQMGLQPDRHIFTTVFHVCGVMGAVDEGMLHFESMTRDFGIDPGMDHYSSIVGMLGATGYLDEAMEFIENMPVQPSLDVWEVLMNLCRVNGNVDLGDRCAEIVESIDSSRLTNESKAGLVPVKACDPVKKEKKKLELLAARSKMHEYRCGDKSHPEKDRVYGLIWSLAPIMKEAGYVPDTRFVLHDVDQESREDALLYHSERLATAHGLLTSHARSPIRVIKNLRICGDCHNAMKILSKVVGRQLIMRDAKRFHHFENGVCSCRDYW